MATYLDELVQKITTKADLKGFDDLNRKQKRAIKSNDLLAKSFRRAFGIFFGIQGIRSVIQTTRDLDLLQKSIKGLTGSAQDWQYLRQEAYRTGTDLAKAAQSYKNFYSAANMAGFKKPQIQSMFSDVLTAGRGAGISQEQQSQALVAMEQILSKGKLSAEEIRRQMGNALPGAFEIAAKAMGVTTAQLDEMLKKGEIAANDFLPKFVKELKKTYEQGFESNIKSLDFALVNLNNAWKEFQANILQGEAGEALAQLVRDVTAILRNQELLDFIKLISKGLAWVIKHVRLLLTLFITLTSMKIINGLVGLHRNIWKIAIGTKEAAAYTRALAIAYTQLTNKQIQEGLITLARSTKALIAPWLKLLGVLEGIKFTLAVIQDLWLYFTDPEALTFTGYLANRGKHKAERDIPSLKPFTAEQADKATGIWAAKGKQLKFKQNKDGLYELQGIGDSPIIENLKPKAPMVQFLEGIRTPEQYGSANYSNRSMQSDTKSVSYSPTVNIYTGGNMDENKVAMVVENVLYGHYKQVEMGLG